MGLSLWSLYSQCHQTGTASTLKSQLCFSLLTSRWNTAGLQETKTTRRKGFTHPVLTQGGDNNIHTYPQHSYSGPGLSMDASPLLTVLGPKAGLVHQGGIWGGPFRRPQWVGCNLQLDAAIRSRSQREKGVSPFYVSSKGRNWEPMVMYCHYSLSSKDCAGT